MPPKDNTICGLVYTCEDYLPIFEMFAKEWNELGSCPIPMYVASHRFTNHAPIDGFTYLTPDIPADTDGTHWYKTMLYALYQLPHDYVFAFLDDFMVVSINWPRIMDEVLPFVRQNNATSLTFQGVPIGTTYFTPVTDEGAPVGLHRMTPDFPYKNSTQPAIWNRLHLINLLEKNPTIRLHTFDAVLEQWDDPSYVRFATNNKINASDGGWPGYSTFISYIEIMRWQAFNVMEPHATLPYLRYLVEKYNLHDDPRCDTFFDRAEKEADVSMWSQGVRL